jgi:cytoskeleton protein RodZ
LKKVLGMSENQGQEGAAAGADSAGTLIRRAREQAGLHVAFLAINLKVPAQRIQALEADRHDLLPGPVFTRALASSLCRQLKLDPAPVLALLPSAPQHDVVVPAALSRTFRVSGHGNSTHARPRLSRPAAIAGALLLLAAVLVYAFPGLDVLRQSGPAMLALPTPKAPGVVTETVAPVHLSATSTMAVAQAGGAATGAGLSLAAPPASPPASPAAAPVNAAAAAPVAADPGPLSFSVQRSTWVEVVDAGGVVVLRRMLNTGEEISAAGQMPLRVTVGNASGLQARVRGQLKDLLPLAQNNVARFEVN